MKLEKQLNSGKNIERKKFFYSLGLGFLSVFAAKYLVFDNFTRRAKVTKPKRVNNSRVKINPLAISRKKIEASNA